MFDRHPNQGRRAWPLQSGWVVFEHGINMLPSRLDGFGVDNFLSFSESADIFFADSR